MSKRDFRVDIDLNSNQLLNPVLHNQASHPATTSDGYTYFDSVANTVYVYSPSNPNSVANWLDLGSAGITDLGYIASANTVTSNTGNDAVLTLADGTNAGLMSSAYFTNLANTSGTNTGDQTAISDFTGTKTDFNTALTNGTFMFTGDAPTAHTHLLAAGATDVTATATEVNILDLSATALTTGWGYFADGVSTASWRQLLGSEINNNQGWTNNTGTVTSVGISGSEFSIGSSPITTSGTITLALAADGVANAKLANMAANTVKLNATAGLANPTDYLINTNSVLGRVGGNIQNIVIDSDLSSVSASDDTVASAKAIKSYVDSSVSGQLVYQGGYNAATNTPDLDVSPSGVNKGFTYTVTANGTFFSESVQIGDVLISEINNPTVAGDWTIVNKNIPDIVNASTTQSGLVEAATDAEVTANTGTGGTGALLFITPAQLQFVDTVGTIVSGTWNATNLAETQIDFTDIVTNNASITKHGYLPKLSNVATQYLNGTGGWSTPPTQQTTFTLDGDTGTSSTIAQGNTLTVAGGSIISTVVGSDTVTVNHDNVTRNDATSSASPAHGGTFDVVDSVTSTAQGHITGINVKTVTLPSNDGTVKTYSALFGNGSLTSFPISQATHGLNSNGDLHVQVRDASTGAVIDCEIIISDASLVTLNFNVAPTTNEFKVVILG